MIINIDFEKCPECGVNNLQLSSEPIIEKMRYEGWYHKELSTVSSELPKPGETVYIDRGNDYNLRCLSCGINFGKHPIILEILKKIREKLKL